MEESPLTTDIVENVAILLKERDDLLQRLTKARIWVEVAKSLARRLHDEDLIVANVPDEIIWALGQAEGFLTLPGDLPCTAN